MVASFKDQSQVHLKSDPAVQAETSAVQREAITVVAFAKRAGSNKKRCFRLLEAHRHGPRSAVKARVLRVVPFVYTTRP